MKSLVRPLEEPFFEKSSQFIAWIQQNQRSTERKKNNEKNHNQTFAVYLWSQSFQNLQEQLEIY